MKGQTLYFKGQTLYLKGQKGQTLYLKGQTLYSVPEIAWKHSHFVLLFPRNFSFRPNFHACFYNSIETRKMFSIS